MPKYHGKDAVVYLSTTGAGAASVITMTRWSINKSTDKVPVTSFGDLNKTYVAGLPDLTGTISGFWDSADDKLFQAADSITGANMYLYPSKNAPTKYWYGPAWLDASIDIDVNGAIAISGTFAANGSWGRL